MQEIIERIDRELLLSELTEARLLRPSNKGDNLIYVVDAHTAPHTMREIGRLREIAFRDSGGGTGLECDIDEFDTMDPPCRQLVVWDPNEQEIVGGYRFILGSDIRFNADGTPRIATSHMFRFSDNFLQNYLPKMMELGRSFVSPEYQSSRAGRKAIYVLDNLWDGLGAITVLHPEIEYVFGKMTMYPRYGERNRDILLSFLNKHFPDPDSLVEPITPLPSKAGSEEIASIFTGKDYREDYKILNKTLRDNGRNIPPLVNSYMSLSPTMRTFGTAINDQFGDVEETAIFMTLSEILPEKKARHISTFRRE